MAKCQGTVRLPVNQSKCWCPALLGVETSFILRSCQSWDLRSVETTIWSLLDTLVFVADCYIYRFCLLVCYIRIYWIFIFVFATFVYQSSDSPVLAGQIICTAVPLQRHPVNSVQGNNRSLFGQLHGTCKCTKCRILMLTACGTYSYRSALGC